MRFHKIADSSQRNVSGQRVKEARLTAAVPMTQASLAAAVSDLGLAMDRVTIAKIETGQRCVFDFELRAFAIALNRTPAWLLDMEVSPFGTIGKSTPKAR